MFSLSQYSCGGKLTYQPWHQGMDFDRGEYVSKLPGGEEALKETIEELRTKVEQVSTQLT